MRGTEESSHAHEALGGLSSQVVMGLEDGLAIRQSWVGVGRVDGLTIHPTGGELLAPQFIRLFRRWEPERAGRCKSITRLRESPNPLR